MKSYMNIDEGSNLTELSPILTCIRTLNESEALWDGGKSQHFKSLSLKQLKSETNVINEDGFCFAVSLQDGSTLYVSSSITTHLGYPKDMLVGQCIMNFLYHKDHITFANHLTQGLNACFIQGKRDDSHLVPTAFFCRLRVYHGLKYGYGVSDKKTQFKPFKVTLHINDLIFDDVCVEKSSSTLCVKATATPVTSAYAIPEEIPAMTSFSTRHTASCHFSHVDASAIPYLGYLPQDMIGYSVFDFYHIDDMPQLKDIYELVIKEQGTSFRSKPYHFKVQNGCYIMLETEWSCFINPWSRKLEFVVGQHRVLKGPSDINIFNPCEVEENTLSEEILKESLSIQKEIKALLSQSIQNYGADKSKRFCNKRKRDLASFVYNCVDEGYEWNKQENSEKQGLMEEGSNSDLDSVVMGDISPYRDLNDSSASSETPPTVQQLRYQENIERFFASQPKTYSDGSDEYNKSEKLSNGEEYQGSSSTSGNASKDQRVSPSGYVANYENKIQESSSNSSKCNMSSFTTGDSGYKSTEKEAANYPNASQASTSNQTWITPVNGKNAENFSTCLALTEESLSVHNRINHKYFKHRKNKVTHASTNVKDCNWLQQNESGHSNPYKHKKCAHTRNLTTSTPTQTDMVKLTRAGQPTFSFTQPFSSGGVPATSSVPQVTASSSFAPHPYLISPSNCAPTAPPTPTATPFFIPVVYMGTLPYYPPISNVLPQSGTPYWPTAPGPPTELSSLPISGVPFPAFTASSFGSYSGIPFGVQSSGVTTASLVATTTTTVASETAFKNTTVGTTQPNDVGINTSKTNLRGSKYPEHNMETNEQDMQVEDTHSSTYTQSSSRQSVDKDECLQDMDFEMRAAQKCEAITPRAEKVNLDSEIAYRYQMGIPNMEDVLKKDLEVLKSMQQPELVNKQLQMLQSEITAENENKVNTANNFYMTESIMLGLTTEDDVKQELEYREECLLQLMCEDA